MTKQTTFFGKDTTKFSHELCHILDEVAHCRPAVSRIRQFGSDVVGSVDSFASSELGLGFISETRPYLYSLGLFRRGILGWSAKRRSHDFDAVILEFLAVFAIEINFVTEEAFGFCPKAFLKEVYVGSELGCFVVCIPAVMVDER